MAQANMRIIELENRCTGNRTVGSADKLLTREVRRIASNIGKLPQLLTRVL
jgi:hypothetical protein